MTKGAGTCWQQEDVDDGFQIWIEPPKRLLHHTDPKPCALTERCRLSWACLLLLFAVLSDHLWFHAEAKLDPDKLASPPRLLSPSSTRPHTDPHIFVDYLNSTQHPMCDHLQPLNYSSEDSSFSKNHFTFANVDHLCANISERDRNGGGGTWDVNVTNLYLSFCDSYSLLDLLEGSTRPDKLNCSLEALHDGPEGKCGQCVGAYQRYDLHAQEKYEDFELLVLKYETGPYSVRTCMEECKMAYKWWLCAQFFPNTNPSCSEKVPCSQSCLQVQQSCPFILPDNDDLIHGGSPSFICTGLLGEPSSDSEAHCCDVRWDSPSSAPGPSSPAPPPPLSHGTVKRTATSSCHLPGASLSPSSSSAAGPRLKICLLALVLLHTVILISHNTTLTDEGSSNED